MRTQLDLAVDIDDDHDLVSSVFPDSTGNTKEKQKVKRRVLRVQWHL